MEGKVRTKKDVNIQHSTIKIAIGIPRHTNTSEVVVCIYGSAIERFCDKQGNETEMVCFQIIERRKCMK